MAAQRPSEMRVESSKPWVLIWIVLNTALASPPLHSQETDGRLQTVNGTADESASERANPDYQTSKLRGWTVHVSRSLLADFPDETAAALNLLADQLEKTETVLPNSALEALRATELWLSPPYPGSRPTAEYHPNRKWLIENGRNPQLHRGIEFTNVSIFPQECIRMPFLLVHELAHAFHDQVIGFDDARIVGLFEKAKDSGQYERVQRWRSPDKPLTSEKAYALSNAKEYFAEGSEAFFGRNDFFPFTRPELKRHDPAFEQLLEHLWQSSPDDRE